MKKHISLIALCCLSFQLTAQIKNTYSFAQGDITQVVITWDAWAETGDPILGCNIFRYEDKINPINAELLTSTDSAYYFVDTTGFDPYLPPRYIIKAVGESDDYTIAKPYAFSSIEFYTVNDSTLQIHLHLWNIDVEFLGLSIFYNTSFNVFLEYPCDNCYVDFERPFGGSWQEGKAFILNYYTRFTPWIPQPPLNSIRFEFLYPDFWDQVYAEITFKSDFFDYLVTTVGITDIPEVGTNFSVYPNPLTESASVSFSLPKPSNTMLELYDAGGRKLKSLYQGILPSGEHTFELNRSQLPPGLYFLKLNADAGSFARKIVVY